MKRVRRMWPRCYRLDDGDRVVGWVVGDMFGDGWWADTVPPAEGWNDAPSAGARLFATRKAAMNWLAGGAA